MGARVQKALMTFEQKRPIILAKSHLVDLVIRQVHEKNQHCEIGLTMTLIREKYYIPALQQRVKKWIMQCVKCIRPQGMAVIPKMADLPSERVTPAVVFENVGTDLCGPFQVKAWPLRRSIKIMHGLDNECVSGGLPKVSKLERST